MASVLTHKKVPEWGGFNWDSPRQRHRFCYIVDGGASFFSDLGNQNISGFRHTKQIEITKSTKYLNKFKIKKQNPTDLTYTDCVHEIRRKKNSSDFAAGTMIQQIFATESALSRSEVFWFSFRYPKEKNFSPDLSCPVCTPIIRGISLQIHFFVVFFCLFISNGIRRKKNLQIFRCSDLHNPDPTVFCHLRSDGFLALQIRRFFGISDPTVFGHTPDPKDFSPPNSPWIFDYQNQAGCGTRKIWTKFK